MKLLAWSVYLCGITAMNNKFSPPEGTDTFLLHIYQPTNMRNPVGISDLMFSIPPNNNLRQRGGPSEALISTYSYTKTL